MWIMWLDWQALGMPEDFSLEYPETFDMRDEHLELDLLMKTRSAGVNNQMFQDEISRQIVALTVDDAELQSEILADMNSTEVFETHVMVDPRTGKSVLVESQVQHLALLEQGYTHEG
jgi:hypothetical protein